MSNSHRSTNRYRILVVEDEGIVALDIKNRLSRMGHTIVGVADSGEDAISLVLAAQPQIVLMDIRLKGQMDGISAAQIIRQRSSVPIIYLTASADYNTTRRAELEAPAPILLKPFDILELQQLIDRSLAATG